MTLEVLQLIWFGLIGILMVGYACLDGFDMGVGILHPFHRSAEDRRFALNAIGPFWDGNEVWLITFGGAMFACFPTAYAAAFSGFFLPFMMLLCCLILRGISLEFRDKRPSPIWHFCWDVIFFMASLLATFLFGVAVGNMFFGLPVDAVGDVSVSFWSLLNWYSIIVGVMAVVTFAMHGSIFLFMKSTGEVQQHTRGLFWVSFVLFLIVYLGVSICSLVAIPSATRNFIAYPWVWALVVVNVLAILNIARSFRIGSPFQAFFSSCVNIACLVGLLGVALFPNLVVSTTNPEHSLTIYNASSSLKTMQITLIIAIIGMPFVLLYTGSVYWVFRGKATKDIYSSEHMKPEEHEGE